MKSFLEEYGFAILAAIVVILLIAMCTPVGNAIKSAVLSMVDKFTNTANSKLDAADSENFSAVLWQNGKNDPQVSVTGTSSTDNYIMVVHTSVAGKEVTFTSATASTEGYTKVTSSTAGIEVGKTAHTGTTVTYGAGGETEGTDMPKADDGADYYVELIDVGTGTVFTSNHITYAAK